MRAIVLDKPRQPLQLRDVPKPKAGRGQLLVRVSACAVCRTDLHVVDGELRNPKLSLIPGHQIVGRVEELGAGINPQSTTPTLGREHAKNFGVRNPQFEVGDRVGIPWLGWTDGDCVYCRSDRENLCDNARFTGYTIDGGYAEFTVADARFCFHLPDRYNDVEVAPLLCAGLIGYRSYRKTGDAQRLGIYGFGNAAHLIAQIALYEGRELFVFTRPGDTATQEASKNLGAVWAGGSDQMPPEKLDAAIIFASVGPLVPTALRALAKGGIVVCGGIHMSDIPSFPYRILWEERVLRSIANLTRRDGLEFLPLAQKVPMQTKVNRFPIEQANAALDAVRSGKIEGAAVLSIVEG
jgi:propanol-preferring alcohol dehydrogenase